MQASIQHVKPINKNELIAIIIRTIIIVTITTTTSYIVDSVYNSIAI